MCSFSRDYVYKNGNSNVLTDLHVYRIHTAPGFLDSRTSILVIWDGERTEWHRLVSILFAAISVTTQPLLLLNSVQIISLA